MRLIQFLNDNDQTAVGIVESLQHVKVLQGVTSMLALANRAIAQQTSLESLANLLCDDELLDYQQLLDQGRLLSPIRHPDPAHLVVSGTGLTHLGSAATRAAMHSKVSNTNEQLTDTMKMFQMGVKGGKPQKGELGVQPEWFYKGDGDIIAAPEADLVSPAFALDGSEEPEIAGIYLIAYDGTPYRIGFCLGNEFSDHVTEQINYLYLAHSKLRPCSLGPELLLGELPKNIIGNSRIIRQDENGNENIIWQKEFLSGEDNMSHTIANLEYHHFKYQGFLRPGDIHVHFFGTGTLSFGDGIKTECGDIFEIQSDTFGQMLRNKLVLNKATPKHSATNIKSL